MYFQRDISPKSKHVISRLIKVDPLKRMKTEEMDESFWEWYFSD
jgi:hypothetical protein